MTDLLRGKTAVVSGCNRGIGRAILDVFVRNGASVWACVREAQPVFLEEMKVLSDQYKVAVKVLEIDFSDSEKIKDGAKEILLESKSIHILVNNAGAIFTSAFQMTSLEKMREMFDINCCAPILFTQYIVKSMIKNKQGSIVNISSSAAIEGNEGRLAYASSKSALLTATKVMAKELAIHNIRVNAIAPGLTETRMMVESTAPDALDKTLARTCLKRVGQPVEIANVALFLASDLSSYMTSQILRVDGGM